MLGASTHSFSAPPSCSGTAVPGIDYEEEEPYGCFTLSI